VVSAVSPVIAMIPSGGYVCSKSNLEGEEMKGLNSAVKVWLGLIILALCIIAFRSWLTVDSLRAQAPTSKDNEELVRLHHEDQADRSPADGKEIDWSIVGPRDKARLARVKVLYKENRLHTGADYYHAAMILQHSDNADDFLLAHEFCVVAISKGKNDRYTRWLAAASEDRFLMNIGRPQRFATQYRAIPANAPIRLYQVDDGVTDELRRALDVPSLARAKAKEVEINKK
jgi:hypothetical protein